MRRKTTADISNLLGVSLYMVINHVLKNPDAPIGRKNDGSWFFDEDQLCAWWKDNQPIKSEWQNGEAINLTQLGKLVDKSYRTMKMWVKAGMPVKEEGSDHSTSYSIDLSTALEWMVLRGKITETEKEELLQEVEK